MKHINLKTFFTLIVLLSCTTSISHADTAVVEGRILFDGQILHKLDHIYFWFRDNNTNTVMTPKVEFSDGIYQIFELPPGNYYMKVVSQQSKHLQGTLPGDLKASVNMKIENSNPNVFDINMAKLIHLTRPINNSKYISRRDCGYGEVFTTPVMFTWEPIISNAEYNYSIYKGTCNKASAYEFIGEGKTKELFINLDLPVSKRNEFYILMLSAFKDSRPVGTLETRSRNFLAEDYRFRVMKPGAYYNLVNFFNGFTNSQSSR